MKNNYKFLNLCGLSTESFLAIWPSQYKFLINEFFIKKVCRRNLKDLYFHGKTFLQTYFLVNLRLRIRHHHSESRVAAQYQELYLPNQRCIELMSANILTLYLLKL